MLRVGFLILLMRKLFAWLSAIIIIISCSENGQPLNHSAIPPLPDSLINERWKEINIVIDSIREGDLVLRCGDDFTSESLRDFSQNEKIFSHSGVALNLNGKLYIFSNMAGDLNPDEVMRHDDVDSFLSPVNNVAAGVYRYDFSNEELDKLRGIVIAHYNNKLQFDMNFDLSTDNKMYCAEMIAKSVEQATNKRILIPKSLVNDDLRQKYIKMALDKKVIPSVKSADQREYWAIDNLYLNNHCREVIKVIFAEPKAPVKFPVAENYEH